MTTESAPAAPPESPDLPETPYILQTLPDYEISVKGCSPRLCRDLDLLMLGMESIEYAGGEMLLRAVSELELQPVLGGRTRLWRLRCTNPWRRSYMRRSLQLEEAKALILITNHRVRQRTAAIRSLRLAHQQMKAKGIPLEQNPALVAYFRVFRAHFRTRMNRRRAKVANYLQHPESLNALALVQLDRLLFCTGTAGVRRLWSSLFDGEIRN